MTFKRLLGIAIVVCAVATLAGSLGAGAASTPAKRAIDLSTNTGVREYLRSVGISPRGVVIQRGAKNYAGLRCPGKRWTCTRSLRVVQIATGHGKNMFRCTAARCVVVQLTKSPLATNTAKCVKTTGITQACSITQSSTGNDNRAIIYMDATKLTGLTQNASQTAQIVQTAGTGKNEACVFQRTTIDGSTVARRGTPVSVSLDAHQSISIAQNSQSGGNTVQNASSASSGSCASGALNQQQKVTSRAQGTAGITQNLNTGGAGPNMVVNIAQNQGAGYLGSATGTNVAKFDQANTLAAIASGSVAGPVSQTESTTNGGIEGTVNQFSHDQSTILVNQTEIQCVHAQTVATSAAFPPCPTGGTQPSSLTQVQHGPMRKGHGPSVQGDNPNSTFTVNQSSTQNSDGNATQTNTLEADCSTSGNCTATQETNVDGEQTTNTSSGQDVNSTIECTGSSCTASGIAFDGSPGTAAPPPDLGPYTMTPFGPDPQPTGTTVTGVSDPAGTITFSQPLTHSTIGNGWATWSHGYTGDVYHNSDGSAITITLPDDTKAFYLYAEPNTFDVFNVQATAQDGTTSGPVPVQGDSGARYFGFYGTGDAEIATITVTTTDTTGLGVGEFGIFPAGPVID
jgi:hypothetical protein